MGTNYQNERVYGARVSDAWKYRGLKTVILENKHIRIQILSDKGADISSFVHKATDTEFMFKTPWGIRNPSLTVPSTGTASSVWLDFYEGGWQSVIPHGGHPRTYFGGDFGLHGDVNNIPWDTKIITDSPEICEIEFTGRSIRSPFEIKKTISLKSDDSFIEINQEITNYAEEDLNVVWLEHIAIGGSFLAENCTLTVPDCNVITRPQQVDKSSKFKPRFSGKWPMVDMQNGSQSDLRVIPGKSDRSLDMAYLTDLTEGWYTVTNNELNLSWGVEFPKDLFQYLQYWRLFGGGFGYPWYGRCYAAGLEPCTSWHESGKDQSESDSAYPVRSGETISANIKAGIIENYNLKEKLNPFK